MSTFPVVYLTGAPATGKSTLSRNLSTRRPDVFVFTYSLELRKFLERKRGVSLTEDGIRTQSAAAITAEDIAELDEELVSLVASTRRERPVLIDSHPVTKESYGFRVTGFKLPTLEALSPDFIICLYAAPDVTIGRIERDAMGRPMVSEFEASFHAQLQASIAAQYGVLLGKAAYFLDSNCPEEQLVETLLRRVKL